MYDREWARRIVVQFRNVRTRTNNLDACIIEEVTRLYPECKSVSALLITHSLIEALRNKCYGRYWRAYQKLQKITPLSMTHLTEVAQWVAFCYEEERTKALQREFDWKYT
jgi:hypothetical protein